MNLLCPNCQNQLQVPEQYAGQAMKCPTCGNNFTVPALAPAPASSPPAHEPEIFGIAPEPVIPATSASALGSAAAAPPPPPPPVSPRPQAAVSGGYAHSAGLTLDPAIVPWIAPVCLVLVFFLSFFPWVGLFYGGYGVITQSAWGTAFGVYSIDKVYNAHTEWEKTTKDDEKPSAGVLMIFFLLALLPAVALGVASIAIPRLKGKYDVPSQAAHLLPWRWLITCVVTLVALVFLFLQLITSFSIESKAQEAAAKATGEADPKAGKPKTDDDEKWDRINEGRAIVASAPRRTIYLRLSFYLLVLAVAGAAGAHWIEHRGAGQLLPRIEIQW